MKRKIYLILILIFFNCKKEQKNSVTESDKIKTESINIEIDKSGSQKIKKFDINENFKKNLEEKKLIDFTEIEEGNISEFEKLKKYNVYNEVFQKDFYGECWNSRPKNFHELDYVETRRKSLFKLSETNINLLKVFDLIGFNFNNKNRIYASEIIFTGKHICNNKVYNYCISISILYKVKLKKGSITISNLDELSTNVSAKKAEVEYFYFSKGIQINPNSSETPKYSNTGSGIFNSQTKIDLDNKIEYFLKEISKKNGTFIGRPFPESFEIYIAQ